MAHDCDVLVIGGGPSGLFAALEAARRGKAVILLEKGGDMAESLCPKVTAELRRNRLSQAERARLQCRRCTCLEGLGGAAFHFDTTLGYADHLSRSKIENEPVGHGSAKGIRKYSGLERAVGSFERAAKLISDVFDIFEEFGLLAETEQQENSLLQERSSLFDSVDVSPAKLVSVPVAIEMIGAMRLGIEKAGGKVFLRSEAEKVGRGKSRRWRVAACRDDSTRAELEADDIVLAVGKSALRWMQSCVAELDLEHEPCNKADIGTRIETWREDMEPLVARVHNPKLAFLNERRESVRTFCVTPGGRMMQYQFAGLPVLEGQHFFGAPTTRTNIGVVTTVQMEPGLDGTEYALEIGRRVSDYGGGKPVVQQVSELVDVPATRTDGGRQFSTSLIDSSMGELRKCLPAHLVDDLVRMIGLLNQVSPGCVQPYAVVAAPVIERISPSLHLSADLETSQPGIFVVGDCSSKLIGITYGAATGLAAARCIAGR